MKQKIYILGVVTTLITFTGAIFKVNHWPAAGILLTLGLVTLALIFIPAALINQYKAEERKESLTLYIVTGITCFVVFTAMLFKIQHWPYAGVLLTIALPFPYVPVFLGVTAKNKNFNIYNTVFVLFLLALNSVFAALLALNVTKTKIDDSYNLARNYNKLETVLAKLPAGEPQNPVNVKIGEALKIVEEYQGLILRSEGISLEQWNANAGNLYRPDSRNIASAELSSSEAAPLGGRLEKSLKSLISEMQNTPGYEAIAKAAPGLFYFSELDPESVWGEMLFQQNTLSWSLITLDGLKANLQMIKTSCSSAKL
jgi:putative Mn2+ efflux pump MntP